MASSPAEGSEGDAFVQAVGNDRNGRIPQRPGVPAEEDVTQLLREHYGLIVLEQQEMGGESDRNLKVTTVDGQRFLLKISQGTIDDPGLRWQSVVLLHLESRAPKVPVPRSVPSLSGTHLVQVGPTSAPQVARLLTWLDGAMLVDLEHHSPTLLRSIGRVAAQLTTALTDVTFPSDVPSHHWDVRQSASSIGSGLQFVTDDENRSHVEQVLSWFERVAPRFDDLPRGVVHNDINDFNVLTMPNGDGHVISGVLDIGDATETIRVAEVAVSVAYAMLRKDDPLAAACEVVAGFDAVIPLTDAELGVIFPIASARLCVNATTWTRRIVEAGTPYGAQRMRHTWPTLARVVRIEPAVAEAALRRACGRIPSPEGQELDRSLRHAGSRGVFASGVVSGSASDDFSEFDLSPASDLHDGTGWHHDNPQRPDPYAQPERRPVLPAFTRHLATSLLQGARRGPGVDEPATVQLGARLMLERGHGLTSPLDGVVVDLPVAEEAPLVVRHEALEPGGNAFWTCWWGVETAHHPGTPVHQGAQLGVVADAGDPALVSGVTVQVFADEALATSRPPRWVRPREKALWAVLAPDPAPLLGLPTPTESAQLDASAVIAGRDRHLARSQRSYYARPMNLVRGRGVWLYDEHGHGYLDAINNVTHVGHAEPRVAAAAARQLGRMNTNSRFVYEGIARYTEQLTATLPEGLDVVFLVCTGSEANDLALRIARQVTGRSDVVVIDGAYHGNTTAVTGISPNRYKGPGGSGAPPTTHEVVTPDRYRGAFGYGDADAGPRYAQDVARVFDGLAADRRPPAAFIAESLLGTAGCISLPPGYLAAAFDTARSHGSLCISDEVQVGVGRLGESFWGFELQGVVPDIVTMGKPLGNGHPLAAVVTTREIADAFDNGAKYFNTFGGSPLACAVGKTVLDIVEDDGLQKRALEVGGYFRSSLLQLAHKHPSIGDVRAEGLYVGIDLVTDPQSKAPATSLALAVAERMKDDGVIVYPTGTADNVLKAKPPMVFAEEHVDVFVEALDSALTWCLEGLPRYR